MSMILLPFRIVFGTARLPVRVVRVPVKVFGFRGTVALALGVVVGLLVAPRTGEETRRMLREWVEDWQASRLGIPGEIGAGSDGEHGTTTAGQPAAGAGAAAGELPAV